MNGGLFSPFYTSESSCSFPIGSSSPEGSCPFCASSVEFVFMPPLRPTPHIQRNRHVLFDTSLRAINLDLGHTECSRVLIRTHRNGAKGRLGVNSPQAHNRRQRFTRDTQADVMARQRVISPPRIGMRRRDNKQLHAVIIALSLWFLVSAAAVAVALVMT